MTKFSPTNPESFEGLALRKLFADFEANNIRYAVLRNYEQLPDRVGSRDLDLLVNPEDKIAAIKSTITLANEFGLQVSDLFEDDMFTSIWLFRRFSDGAPFTLSIDIFPGRRVYGIELYSVDKALSDLRLYRGIPVVREPFVFLDKWLYHLIVGQPTPTKYDQLFKGIANRHYDELLKHIETFLGRDKAEGALNVVRAGRSSSLIPLTWLERLRLLSAQLDFTSVKSLNGPVVFLSKRVRDQFRLRGLFLSISGPDGSGKTTVIRNVIAQLEKIFGSGEIQYSHFRPTFLPRIAEVAKKARAIDTVDENYDQPHRAKPSGVLGSIARLVYYFLDYLGGYTLNIRPVLKRREVVLFDRYYYDMICDPGRSRIGLPFSVLCFVGRLLPLPKYSFFIHVEAYEIYRRKQELSLDRIRELNGRYMELVRSGVLCRIDNNGPFELAAAEIVDAIIEDRDTQARRLLSGISL